MTWKLNPDDYRGEVNQGDYEIGRTIPEHREIEWFIAWARDMYEEHDLGPFPAFDRAATLPGHRYLNVEMWRTIHEVSQTIHLACGGFEDFYDEFHPPEFVKDECGRVVPQADQTLNFRKWNHDKDGIGDCDKGKLALEQWRQHWPRAESVIEEVGFNTGFDPVFRASGDADIQTGYGVLGPDIGAVVEEANDAAWIEFSSGSYFRNPGRGEFDIGANLIGGYAFKGVGFDAFFASPGSPGKLRYEAACGSFAPGVDMPDCTGSRRTIREVYGESDMLVNIRYARISSNEISYHPLLGIQATRHGGGFLNQYYRGPASDYQWYFTPFSGGNVQRKYAYCYYLNACSVSLSCQWVRSLVPVEALAEGTMQDQLAVVRNGINAVFHSDSVSTEGGGEESRIFEFEAQGEVPAGCPPYAPPPDNEAVNVDLGGQVYENAGPGWIPDVGAEDIEIPKGYMLIYVVLPDEHQKQEFNVHEFDSPYPEDWVWTGKPHVSGWSHPYTPCGDVFEPYGGSFINTNPYKSNGNLHVPIVSYHPTSRAGTDPAYCGRVPWTVCKAIGACGFSGTGEFIPIPDGYSEGKTFHIVKNASVPTRYYGSPYLGYPPYLPY